MRLLCALSTADIHHCLLRAPLLDLEDEVFSGLRGQPDGSGDFVTSDHPVSLIDLSGRPPPPLFPPGHGMTKTAVLFPICRRIMLYGRFEGGEFIREYDRDGVAHFNSEVIDRAERQVYACDDSFSYMRDDTIATGAGLARDPLFTGPQSSDRLRRNRKMTFSIT